MKKLNPNIIWIVLAVLCLSLTLTFAALFLKPYYQPTELAIEAGKRVEINLKTGEIKQAPPPAKPEEAAKPEEKPEPDKVEELPQHAEAKEEKKPEAAEEVKKEEDKKQEEVKASEEPKNETLEEVKKAEVVAPKAEETAAEKKPDVVIPKGPRVAILMVEAGLSRSSTELMLKLPSGVSLSFSPYASDLAIWVREAVKTNHEVYLDLPIEPKDYPYTDPGPYALLTSLSDEENIGRLKQILGLAEGYRGLVANPEERFTDNATSYKWLFETMKEKQLSLVFVARPSNHKFRQDLEEMKASALGVDLILDSKLTSEAIDAQLAQAEAMAKQSGFAIALARPYPISVERIDLWAKTLAAKGIQLVPLSLVKAAQ